MTMRTIPYALGQPSDPSQSGKMQIVSNDMRFRLTNSGDIGDIRCGNLQISQYRPGPHDAGTSGLWLRRHRGGTIDFVPLIGARSSSHWFLGKDSAQWEGEGLGLSWTVSLLLDSSVNMWEWQVSAKEAVSSVFDSRDAWDLVVAQDVALAPVEQAMTNEPYISQYIAYRSVETQQFGRILAARQTMAYAPQLPLLVTTIVEGAVAHLTDGFDFYGLGARADDDPVALTDPDWGGGCTNQYEFGMVCMLSEKRKPADGLHWTVLNSLIKDDRGELQEESQLVAQYAADSAATLPRTHKRGSKHLSDSSLFADAQVLNGEKLSEAEFLALGGGEVADIENDPSGHALSYFSSHARHVVSGAKELMVSRSHGQILLACGSTDPDRPVLVTTTFAPGVFSSHIVLGNTNINRLVSVHRNSLNLLKSEGVRMLVKRPKVDSEGWTLLSIPSAYLMDLGGSRWLYRWKGDTITAQTLASATDDSISISLSCTSPLDVMMTIDVESPQIWKTKGIVGSSSDSGTSHASGVLFTPKQGSNVANHCPGLSYVFASLEAKVDQDSCLWRRKDESIQHPSSLVVFQAKAITGMSVVAAATMQGESSALKLAEEALLWKNMPAVEDAYKKHVESISRCIGHLSVHGKGRLSEVNILAPWFAQNALVHFLSPHGLEQYSGAAWGTRDVCQGPLEMALAFGHFDVARAVILKIFQHQHASGFLPQWFMFDAYTSVYQPSAHGDIPMWPLLAVSEYLEASGDKSVLSENIPFFDDQSTSRIPTVADHLERTLDYIRTHRVPGTDLFSYGEGDWDDTLQTARESMKKSMVSTWTIALLFQAAKALQLHLRSAGLQQLAEGFADEANIIEQHFSKDFLFDDVLAGYVSFTAEGPRPIIHPNDTSTGLKYRLFPMTQSIISGLLDSQTVSHHERIIDRYLHYPDGVRLMDHPAKYHDGRTTFFRRGEQAANVGREVGLMYTHAHIRYVEALAKLGHPSVVSELLRISPVNYFRKDAANEIRQRNCYFASSDADFPDRYIAAEQWDRLRSEAKNPVGLRGGWRIYSSGPGIYLSQLIRHVFGLDIHADSVVIDPLLALKDDGTEIDVDLFGVRRSIRYHVVDAHVPVTVSASGRNIKGTEVLLPYRYGGLLVKASDLYNAKRLEITLSSDRSYEPAGLKIPNF